jgi:hypothetical protein
MSATANELATYPIDNPYQFYVDHTLNTLLSNNELDYYNRINTCFASCFAAAKQKNQEVAKQQLEEGNSLLNYATLNVKKWVSVFCMPYISYYYYKIRAYALATKESQRIIQHTLALEKTGHDYLFFCRIQQQQNIGRIQWANDAIAESIKLYAQCVVDIHTQSACWKNTRNLGDMPVLVLAQNTQYLFFIQVITEMLNRIIQRFFKEKSITISWLRIFFKPIAQLNFEQLVQQDPIYQAISEFIAVFEGLVIENDELFIQLSNDFLDNPRYDDELKKVIGRYLYYFNFI